MQVETKKYIKFERIRQQLGCGYYAVCCGDNCPCIHKYDEELDEDVYEKLKKKFEQETGRLFG